MVDGLGLCAEHGYCFLAPGKKSLGMDPSKRWQVMMRNNEEDQDWKSNVLRVMEMYAKRVQGSVIEAKGSCIAWNYRKVAAKILVHEMAMELAKFLDPKDGLMSGYPVEVINGKGFLEV